MTLRQACRTLPVFAAALLTATNGGARNIDLSTAPDRESVQLTIYNSEDLTLVRETRRVSFKRGLNGLQFSWANTLIDPTSVELQFVNSPDQLELLDTTFPHDKPQMLYWNVQSELDGEALVEITYFTSGVTWAADYVCIADPQERQLALEGFVRVTNRSGEQYENAQVRLVVGQINLVEKIAQLAQLPISDVGKMEQKQLSDLRFRAVRKAFDSAGAVGGALASEPPTPKNIIKEGLSEYFIYTIEGEETIPDGWSKRLRSFAAEQVPLRVQYRFRPAEYGEQLVRLYLLRNDTESRLGETPLPDGQMRVFRDNGRNGLSFLAGQSVKYIPIGDKIELNLGPDPEVIFELRPLQVWRDQLWLQVRGADLYRRADAPGAQIEVNSALAGWDEHSRYAQRIRNNTSQPIDVEVRRTFPGHVDFRSRLEASLYDYRTVEFHARVEPRTKADLEYEIVAHLGRNQKQDRVTLLPAD